MIPYMVGKLAPNSSHLFRGVVKYVSSRGYFRAVSSQSGDKFVTSPPPPIVERVLRHSPSSWATVVHWSALLPKALRSSRRHPVHSFSCPPTQPAPHQPSEHHAIRQSRVLYAHHKSRKQYPPPAHHRVDALTSRLHEGVQVGNREIGAVILLPTDTSSQKAVVGSSQRLVVVRARAPLDAAVQLIVSNTPAFSIRVLSSMGALGRSYSSRVYFRKLHNALRMCRSTSMARSVLLWLRFP